MQVNFYATLRNIVGGKTAEFSLEPGATIRDLLAAMIERYPGLRTELLDSDGQLYRHVHIFINGRDANFLSAGLDTVLQPDDQTGIFPAVGGGSSGS